MPRFVPVLSLLILAVTSAALLGSQEASAAMMNLTVNEGLCVQVGTVPSGTGSWSMTASRPFEAVVTSSTGYSYGSEIGSNHQGPATNSNYFLTACNVCPSGPIQVTFTFPGSPDSNSPSSFTAQGYPATCGGGGLGFGTDLDGIPLALQPVLGPLALIVAFLAIVAIAALPPPRGPGSAQAAPPPQFPVPAQQPWPAPQAAPPAMAGPGPRLLPTPWIGVGHDVPADAPPQFPVPGYPPGYPYPVGTYSRMTCPRCGFPTLCPFMDGWFCTNLQCPARTGNVTDFVVKQWYQPQ